VVTGEGSLDEQSLRGKAPIGVVRRAARLGVPVVAVCGRTTLDRSDQRAAGLVRVWSLAELEPDPAQSMARAADLLAETGRDLARALPDLVPGFSGRRTPPGSPRSGRGARSSTRRGR
jgi:glycerate kinase